MKMQILTFIYDSYYVTLFQIFKYLNQPNLNFLQFHIILIYKNYYDFSEKSGFIYYFAFNSLFFLTNGSPMEILTVLLLHVAVFMAE